VVAITTVLGNLGNPLNLVAYAAGFATGNVVGMTIEARLGIGHSNMRVISRGHGRAVADLMRGLGHALTELPGWGKDGTVSVIECSVRRREVPALRQEICRIDETAFITVEEIRPLQRGFWRG
jgi:uncharacterized protein YebE (UPF0316 family)